MEGQIDTNAVGKTINGVFYDFAEWQCKFCGKNTKIYEVTHLCLTCHDLECCYDCLIKSLKELMDMVAEDRVK